MYVGVLYGKDKSNWSNLESSLSLERERCLLGRMRLFLSSALSLALYAIEPFGDCTYHTDNQVLSKGSPAKVAI
jgi:hypothetical protein